MCCLIPCSLSLKLFHPAVKKGKPSMHKGGYYVKKKGKTQKPNHQFAYISLCPILCLSPNANIKYLEHIINNLSQVDLVFPKSLSSFLVPRLHVHSAVSISVMTAKKRVDQYILW